MQYLRALAVVPVGLTAVVLTACSPSPGLSVKHSTVSTSVQNATFVAKAVDLTDAHKKDIAMQLVSSAENSSLNWKAQYTYSGM